MSDGDLLQRFVTSFGKIGTKACETAAMSAIATSLDEFYEKLPHRFPPLCEQLVLSYRWMEVDLDEFLTLLANPPGPTLAPLFAKITADRIFVEVLFPLGLVPFAKASGGCYDPVCFDTKRRGDDGDCPVVRIEHEAVLCDGRVGDQWEVAKSFRSLVEAVIAKGECDP